MAKRKDSQPAADAAPSTSAKSEITAAKIEQPLLEAPKASSASSDQAAVIELEAVHESAAAEPPEASETIAPEPRWRLPSYAPLAATIVFAVALGAVAGAATTSSLLRDPSPPADTAAANAARALQDSVAQLTSELATLKAGIAGVQRSTSTQFGKLAERLDRTEKAQAEPVGKLARIQDSIDRLEQRQQHAAAPAVAPAPAPAPEVTGSVTPKEESRPQVAEGWRLRDFSDGRAIVESRNGMVFRVAPGSNVPGLGRVETIKRENGKVVVVTASGIIAASLEPRRMPPYYRW
jgi:hypothetical protein